MHKKAAQSTEDKKEDMLQILEMKIHLKEDKAR